MMAAMTISELEQETDVAAIIVDSSGFATYVNDAFVELFGWTREEFIGKPLYLIIPANLRQEHERGFARFIATSEPRVLNQSIRFGALRKDGREFLADHFIIAEKSGGEWRVGATIKELLPKPALVRSLRD